MKTFLVKLELVTAKSLFKKKKEKEKRRKKRGSYKPPAEWAEGR